MGVRQVAHRSGGAFIPKQGQPSWIICFWFLLRFGSHSLGCISVFVSVSVYQHPGCKLAGRAFRGAFYYLRAYWGFTFDVENEQIWFSEAIF